MWTGDAAGGGEPTQLTRGLMANPFKPVISPDGKWISLQDRNGRVLLIDSASGAIKVIDKTENLGSYDAVPGTVAFSPNSKYLTYSKNQTNWASSIYLYEIATARTFRSRTNG